MNKKISVALWTHTIDGRAASGTALVAQKWIDVILSHQDEFDVTFLHFESSSEPLYMRGVREVIMPEMPIPFLNRRSLRVLWYFLTTRDRFDIMQWFQPRLYPFLWWVPAKRIVVTVHGAGDIKNEGRFIFSRSVFNHTLRLFRKRVAAAIAGSAYSKRDIVEAYGFSPEQVVVINNGVEPTFVPASAERIAEVRAKYNLPEKFFLGVARFVAIKNVPRTLRAFDAFSSGRADSFHFVNIGAKGPEKAEVDRIVAESPVRDRIHFVGYVETEDLPVFYSAAYALVFPTLNEGFGLPAIEAMACGTPTIISETAQPEITPSDARMVDPLSENAIAEAMRSLVDEPGLRDSLVVAGRVKAQSFTWEISGEKVVALFRSLASSPR